MCMMERIVRLLRVGRLETTVFKPGIGSWFFREMKSSSPNWRVMFLKAPSISGSLLTRQFGNSSGWVHLSCAGISLRYIWRCQLKLRPWGLTGSVFLLIADKVSLAGSLISVPDRKAVLWQGSCPAAKRTMGWFLQFICRDRSVKVSILFLYFVYMREPFKCWSGRPSGVFHELVCEAVDHQLLSVDVYYVYCCTYCCSHCLVCFCCGNREIWLKSSNKSRPKDCLCICVYTLKITRGCVCTIGYKLHA